MANTFPNPMIRGVRKRPHEASRLRSPRDIDAVPRVWQQSSTLEQNVFRMSQAIEQLQRQIFRLRLRKTGEESVPEEAGDWFMGEWDNTVEYSAQQAVEYTPTGGQAGIYVSLTDVPTGTAPDTGAPYWYAWPTPLTTRWSF